jgi:hypothetical protein
LAQNIRRKARQAYSAEAKIRIFLSRLRGEESNHHQIWLVCQHLLRYSLAGADDRKFTHIIHLL